ncbi:MAG: hypothetical protein N3F09_03535 [Bacteroidia bacterium]|nr:hypothetical protein [Bacteroidia bacterium]
MTTSFKPLTNALYISGKVYSDDKELYEQLVGLNLFVIADSKLVAQTFTDKCGHYELSFTRGSEKSFDFFITSIGIDTTLLKSFTTFESDVMTYDFKFPNSYKKKLGKVICPKCSKMDKVYPIIYGDNQIVSMKVVNGDTLYSNIVDKKYYAGTCVHSRLSPNYYCDRDKVKF